MKIMLFNDSPEAPALVNATIDAPLPASGEVLIRVKAAGVTPTELSWYPTTHTEAVISAVALYPGMSSRV
jgi:NADPH:quinone reductase-like Zn-dependent oxidoreductase